MDMSDSIWFQVAGIVIGAVLLHGGMRRGSWGQLTVGMVVLCLAFFALGIRM